MLVRFQSDPPSTYPFSSMDRTSGYGPEDTSSNLVEDAKRKIKADAATFKYKNTEYGILR